MGHIKLTGNQRLEGNIRVGFFPPEQAPAPSSPYNLSVTGESNYNPLTWDFDGADPDYFLLESTFMTNPYVTEKGYTDNSSGIPYDAKSNSTWYIPGNLRQVYVTYGDFGTQYKLRLFAETGGALSDASNIVSCYITMG